MALTRPRAAQIYDIDYKQATRVVTVSNITLSGGAPSQVDGVNLSLNDRVLVTGQSTLSQNGIYYVTTVGSGSNGTWSRSLDTNNTGEILTGTIVMVTEGLIYADTQWKLITDGIIDVGVTDQVWTQNYSANSISSGNSNVIVNSNANVTISSAGVANVLNITATGPVVTGNLLPSSNITYNLGSTDLRWKDLWLSNSTLYIGNVTVAATATTLTVNGANVLTGTASGDILTSGNVSATGNVTGGNLLTSGYVSATGNATAGNINTAGLISATGNITSGNVSATNYIGTTVSVSGNTTSGNVLTGGLVSATGNVIGGNVTTVGLVSATGNVTGGNILTAGAVSAAGNITGDYFLGNVFYANGITASKIYSGNSEVNVTASGGNVNVSIGGTSNVVVFSTAGEYVTGLLSVSGNATAGNILTAGLISATGNITGNYFLGNVACASGIFSTKIFSGTTEANIVSANGNLAISVGGTSNVAVFATTGEYVTGLLSVTGNTTSGNILTGGLVSATANVTGGNILTAGLISATGNVTGNYLIGNASQVTGINTFNQIFVTGTNTINASGLTSNITLTAGNNISLTSVSNVITIAYSASGGGSIFATGGDMGLISQAVTASEDLGNVTTLADTSYDLGTLFSTVTYNQIDMTGFTSNINTGNLNATGLANIVGNINGGNITTVGLISATGNVSGGNLNATGLANIVGNINGGNITTVGLISATGNVSGGNLNVTGNIVDTGALSIITGSNGNIALAPNGTGIVTVSSSLSAIGNIDISTGNTVRVNSNVAINGPAFAAYANSSITQTITSGTQQKVLFQLETFDTNSNFANSRFTPTVAGYYQINGTVRIDGATGTGECMITIWKNGAEYARGWNASGVQFASNFWSMSVSALTYANGSSDYFELYVQQTSGANRTVTVAGNNITYFNGCMMRGA